MRLRPSMCVPLAALAAFAWLGIDAWAGNVDPGGTGARQAWGENAGWFEAAWTVQAEMAAQVGDAELTGYLWQENIGWISLSCQNSGSCASTEFGVHNDGNGALSGEAWSENAGWIQFAPTIQSTPVPGAGVTIDPATGKIHGLAWSENLGWIEFDFSAPSLAMYQMQTSWRAGSSGATPSATPTPTGSPGQTTPTGTHPGSSTPTPTGGARVPASGSAANWAGLLLLLLGAGRARIKLRTH